MTYRSSRLLLASAAALVVWAASPARAELPPGGSWNFRVLLDGKPIGTHRFTLTSEGGQRVLKSVAAFDVKLLGFTAYRYRHEATEQWQGDCLAALTAKTDDDGKALTVKAQREGESLDLQGPKGKQRLDGCVMSFAYWLPAMLKQSQLLNAQTGEYEKVKIEPLGDDKVEAQGKTVAAKHYRITGPEQPVELWYGADGDWLALESSVSGGKRKLTYRRE
jgi:Family of unknown function (DUF6134)